MYRVIIELVESLHSTTRQQQDTKAIAELIVKKQDSSILTYEDLTVALQMEGFSNKRIPLVEAADKYDVLKGVTTNSMTQNLEKWLNEAQRMGLGWIPIDDVVIGFRVDSVQAWLVALILIYEGQNNVKIRNTVDFKFAVDARTLENQQGTICEVMLELLCNPSPLSCVSVAKWEGEDQRWDEIFSHMAKITDSKNLLCQLIAICEDGLDIEDRHLDVTFIECHHMAYYRSIVCNGTISALGEQFCPWCTVPRQARCIVTMNHNVSGNDTIALLSSTYHMRPQLLVELNTFLEDLHPQDKILEFLPNVNSITVFQHWPMNRHSMCKLTPGTTLNTVYCARHALTRTVLRMVKTLGIQAQQHDQISKETQSRFMLLWQAMTNPPLLIECEIATLQHTNYKEIKYDELNMEVANHILENHEKILEVMEKIPTLETFMYTKRMWATYRCFNRLQQMTHPFLHDHDESLAVVAREFLYYATKALGEDITPYIHIQGAHADQFQSILPYSIGRLKNSAIQRKHKAFNNTLFAFCTTSGKIKPYIKQDKIGLNIEMVAQYVRLKMEAMPILHELKKQVECWIPWLARSFFRRHFIQMGYVAISIDKAEELAETFPTTTANQVLCLFNTWSKHVKRQSKYKPLHFLNGLCGIKNNYIEDGLSNDLSTTIQNNEAQATSYANTKCQQKSDLYINQYNLEMANNKLALLDQIRNNEELLQTYNSAILYNVRIMQVDERYSSIDRICVDNEIYNQEEGRSIENTNTRMDWMNNNDLNEKIVISDVYNLIKEKIMDNKSHQLPHQFKALANTKEITCLEDGEENINKQDFDSHNIDIVNINKELKNISIKYSGDDVTNGDKIMNGKSTTIEFVPRDKISSEVSTSNMAANSKQICLKEFNIVEPENCSRSVSLIELQEGISSNIFLRESHYSIERELEGKPQLILNTECEEIIRKEIPIKDNDHYEHNVLKISQENLDNNLNENFVTDAENKNIDLNEHVDPICLEMDPDTSNIDGQNLNDDIVNNVVTTSNFSSKVAILQVTTQDNDNDLKILSLDNQNEHNRFKIDFVANPNLLPFAILEDATFVKDLNFPEESIKCIDEQLSSFRSYSSLNEKEGFYENALVARLNIDNVALNNKTTVDNGDDESSPSQSYSLTPEDGGILRNKRRRGDDVDQREKSFKLRSLEKSLDSLSKKSRKYKKLNMKKTYYDHNLPKTSTFQTTSWSTSRKYDVKEHSSKMNTLNSCNMYICSKQDSNKKKIKTLYPCNPYPQKAEDSNKNKLSSKSKRIESKIGDQSTGHKFGKQLTAQPLFEMKNENTNLSSPRQEPSSNSNQFCNKRNVFKNYKPISPQYSKRNQFIEDDKAFFQSRKKQLEHNEYKDVENDIFMPFLFDDASFSMPNKHCNSQTSKSFCPEEHKRHSSNLKKAVVITPDTCTISTSYLQCQEPPKWFGQDCEVSNPIVIPTTYKNGDNSKYSGSKKQDFQGFEIPHFLERTQEGIENHITTNRKNYEEMKNFTSIENKHRIKPERLEEEFAHIDANKFETKDKYGRPCCCDPSKGHASTCYQYVPNYEPPEVSRIKNTSILDNSRTCMFCNKQCHPQRTTLQKAQLKIPNYNDQRQYQINTLQEACKYYSSHLQLHRDLNEGDVNLESNLSARTKKHDNFEKYCEYDRIGRYRRGGFLRSKVRQK